MNPLLAQLTDAQERQVMVWGGALILLAVGGFGLIMYFKKYMRRRAEQSQYDTGFSLSDLKQMLYRGEITPEEYETTRAHVIAKVKGKMLDSGPKKKNVSAINDRGTSVGSDSTSDSPAHDSDGNNSNTGEGGDGAQH